MSTLYQDLPLTQYPGNLDTFTAWLNILSSDGPLIAQYQAAIEAGNQTQANQILAQIPQGTQKILTATDLNQLTQAIQAVERFYLTDIEPYIQTQQESWLNVINQFSYQGTWSNDTSYVTNNIVSYTTGGLVLLFIATSNPPTGTVPTNTQYWRLLTIQGQQGPSGVGLSYRQEWSSATQYNIDDAVTYDGDLWMALQSNQNVQPGTNSSYWQIVISFETITYPIQDTEPVGADAGSLWFNTQNNPTKYYYLETLDNPITQEMIPVGYQTYGSEGAVLNGTGPLPIPSGGTNATTSQQALTNLGAGVRPNLLDNAYFVGGGTGWGVFPVNQRGKSIYTKNYGIDRWYGNSNITLETNCIKIVKTDQAEPFSQKINIEKTNFLKGKKYTISLLTADGSLYSLSDEIPFSYPYDGPNLQIAPNVYFDVVWHPSSENNLRARIVMSGEAGEASISAMKLEEGEGQTLAYKDSDGTWKLFETPDYATELVKCQAYYENSWFGVGLNVQNEFFGASFAPNTIDTRIPYKVTKRSNPTVTFYGNGVNAGWVIYYDGAYVDASNILVTNMNRGGLQAFVARLTLSGTTVGLHEAIQIQGHWEASAEL